MNIRRIVPNIPSRNMERSRQFFTGFLGMEQVMDMGWIMSFASVSNPTAQVSIVQTDDPASSGGQITLTVETDNVEAALEIVERLGYRIVYPLTIEPWGVRRFAVESPDGVVFNIMQHLEAGPLSSAEKEHAD